jgi:hypothetical protein
MAMCAVQVYFVSSSGRRYLSNVRDAMDIFQIMNADAVDIHLCALYFSHGLFFN